MRTTRAVLSAVAREDSLLGFALAVLLTPAPAEKIALTERAASLWASSRIPVGGPLEPRDLPDHPARPPLPRLVGPREIQSPKRTARAHGLPLPAVLLHNIVHVELTAVDMYWDTVARFLHSDAALSRDPARQREFCDDFVRVVSDEGRHLAGCLARLSVHGIGYGALDCHRSLWDLGVATRDDLAARLALVPLVQEARGLDAGPRFVEQLSGANDNESARLMQQIYEDEISHVRAGMKWFTLVAESRGHGRDIDGFFHGLVRRYMPTGLIPPFNEMARAAAGMGLNMYAPLAATSLPHPPPLRTNG